ncbi:unnamed protein product [Vitrella brassicaformis CCMP3155]|uniref:RING-type domain-containing protein n=2 Tax=Vitrella brassicaformis TaxID=1169539 RepID=A0A0G4EAE1_VITBC|nr:unnamed protein product [Vitrella brassicaformis CCMP3155]|eukprot:CEL92198.1 unnamed protein product [Vitrella brassicaformis CCMP3155]
MDVSILFDNNLISDIDSQDPARQKDILECLCHLYSLVTEEDADKPDSKAKRKHAERRPFLHPDDIAVEIRAYATDEDGTTTLGGVTKPNLLWLQARMAMMPKVVHVNAVDSAIQGAVTFNQGKALDLLLKCKKEILLRNQDLNFHRMLIEPPLQLAKPEPATMITKDYVPTPMVTQAVMLGNLRMLVKLAQTDEVDTEAIGPICILRKPKQIEYVTSSPLGAACFWARPNEAKFLLMKNSDMKKGYKLEVIVKDNLERERPILQTNIQNPHSPHTNRTPRKSRWDSVTFVHMACEGPPRGERSNLVRRTIAKTHTAADPPAAAAAASSSSERPNEDVEIETEWVENRHSEDELERDAVELLKVLKEYGGEDFAAGLRQPDSEGNLPLHVAARAGRKKLVRWLLGPDILPLIDVAAVNRDNESAERMAAKRGHKDCAELIRKTAEADQKKADQRAAENARKLIAEEARKGRNKQSQRKKGRSGSKEKTAEEQGAAQAEQAPGHMPFLSATRRSSNQTQVDSSAAPAVGDVDGDSDMVVGGPMSSSPQPGGDLSTTLNENMSGVPSSSVPSAAASISRASAADEAEADVPGPSSSIADTSAMPSRSASLADGDRSGDGNEAVGSAAGGNDDSDDEDGDAMLLKSAFGQQARQQLSEGRKKKKSKDKHNTKPTPTPTSQPSQPSRPSFPHAAKATEMGRPATSTAAESRCHGGNAPIPMPFPAAIPLFSKDRFKTSPGNGGVFPPLPKRLPVPDPLPSDDDSPSGGASPLPRPMGGRGAGRGLMTMFAHQPPPIPSIPHPRLPSAEELRNRPSLQHTGQDHQQQPTRDEGPSLSTDSPSVSSSTLPDFHAHVVGDRRGGGDERLAGQVDVETDGGAAGHRDDGRVSVVDETEAMRARFAAELLRRDQQIEALRHESIAAHREIEQLREAQMAGEQTVADTLAANECLQANMRQANAVHRQQLSQQHQQLTSDIDREKSANQQLQHQFERHKRAAAEREASLRQENASLKQDNTAQAHVIAILGEANRALQVDIGQLRSNQIDKLNEAFESLTTEAELNGFAVQLAARQTAIMTSELPQLQSLITRAHQRHMHARSQAQQAAHERQQAELRQQMQRQMEERTDCQVCHEIERSVVLQPCGHFCICQQCAQNLQPPECPLCRQVFTSWTNAIFS